MSQSTVTKSLWQSVLSSLSQNFSSDIYSNWFVPLTASVSEEGVLELTATNDFAAIWLEDNYLSIIEEKASEISGEEITVRVLVKESVESLDEEKQEGRSSTNRMKVEENPRMKTGNNGSSRNGHRQMRAAHLNPRNTFENYIVGSSNQLAHAASTAVAASPGNAYNPLFLYGDTGLGKTHLMHSIAHAIQANDPDAKVVYLSCEKFTNKFLTAIRENSLDKFRQFYRKVDVLLIDDIQFLEGKERTQEEFFHTFNELFESQRQLCLSSDRPASEISKLESRLVSRFQWGMVTDIQPPDLETRVAILKKKGQALGFHDLDDSILEFLASRISRNVRRLEGALIKVATYGRLVKHPITTRMVEDLVHDILQEESQNQITIEKIQKKVAEFFDLRISDMSTKKRPSNIAFPRQIAMYLSRILTNHPLKEIGDSFGGRDHGTVIHACKTVENMMEQDETVRRNVDFLSRQLNGAPRS